MSDEENRPIYSASETAAIVLDFLTFLTTLHRDPDDLVMPPPGGWPSYTPENCAGFKSDFTVEVLRNLPYLGSRTSDHGDSSGHIHYKSHLLDYSTFDSARFAEQEYLWSGDEDSVPDHIFVFAEGYESGGRTLFLNLREGTVVEEELRCDSFEQDLREYFEDLKDKYRRLELIPCPGREMIEVRALDVVPEEQGVELSEEEVLAQTDPYWGYSTLDVQYARQLYRAFGWPDNFRRDEAFREIRKLIEKREAKGGEG
ncbi:hypothetical protein ACN27G_31285 [Plantactinospora sp. WMMB334]|uniref:hypothetical protein n=1 Tax=Plantactinospora sp. WMMB334 TaxID=3404119 RepID=UPI003B93B0C3